MTNISQPIHGHPFQVKPLYVRLPEVITLVGLSRPTIYRLIREGSFPSQRKIGGGHASGWLLSEVEAWARSLPPAHQANR
jgi:prophage regulatory protein